MFLLVAFSVVIAAVAGSQSNYNNFNKQQYNKIQAQSSFNQPQYQHQSHHNQFQSKPQQQQQQQQYKPQQQVSYQQNRNFVPITSYKNDVSHDGSYQFSFTTGDGQQQQQSGYLKNRGQPNSEAQVVQGSYSYTSPEGKPITVTYIADELGFRAEGNHLPTPPPIPEAIQKSLQLIRQTQPAPATHNYNNNNNNNNNNYNQNQNRNYNQNQSHNKYGKK